MLINCLITSVSSKMKKYLNHLERKWEKNENIRPVQLLNAIILLYNFNFFFLYNLIKAFLD